MFPSCGRQGRQERPPQPTGPHMPVRGHTRKRAGPCILCQRQLLSLEPCLKTACSLQSLVLQRHRYMRQCIQNPARSFMRIITLSRLTTGLSQDAVEQLSDSPPI